MRWTADQMPDQTGRRALVTGANSGIGFVAALELARHGADVVLAVRNVDAGNAAAGRIRAAGVPGTVVVERLDLASQESVRQLAGRLEGPLDLLVNNAGVMAPPRRRQTADGHELQFATNHLGHFALTGRLMPHLLAAAGPRVTTVSSIAHRTGDARVLDAGVERGYNPQTSYGQSKLANLLFALELQRRATASGSRLTSTAAHPGVSATNLVASPDGMGSIPLVGRLGGWGARLLFPAAAQGAEAVLFAATEAEPGSYTGPSGIREMRGAIGPARISTWARDEELAARLWDLSEEMTGVTVTP
jgi:NAD(P)-dependent dehydrogenase (short-subunit alcohol dehydrogenase family)